MFDLYQEQIIDRSKRPRFAGRAEEATLTAEGANSFCGDEVRLTARVENDIVKELRHETRACAVCAASADLLAEMAAGQRLLEIKALTPEDITEMLGIPLSPTRLKCALLPLETLKQA